MVNLDKIKDISRGKGWSMAYLCSRLNVARSYFTDAKNGKIKISEKRLNEIAEILGTTVEYLTDETDNPDIPEPKPAKKGVKIPVVGEVVAGIPITAVENIIDWEEIDVAAKYAHEYFGLRVAGNSMEPILFEGDTVIIHKQSDIDSGDIAVVLIDNEDATIKKVIKRPDGIMLTPMNPAYEPLFFSNKQISQLPVTVLGKVMELRRKF